MLVLVGGRGGLFITDLQCLRIRREVEPLHWSTLRAALHTLKE